MAPSDLPPLTHPSCLCYPTNRSFTRAETFVFLSNMNRRPYRLDSDGCLLLDLEGKRVLVRPGNYIIWHESALRTLDRTSFVIWRRQPDNTPHVLLSEDARCAVHGYSATGETVEAAPIWLNDSDWRYGPVLNTTLAYLLRDYNWKVHALGADRFEVRMTSQQVARVLIRLVLQHGDWLVRTGVGFQVVPDAAFRLLFTRV